MEIIHSLIQPLYIKQLEFHPNLKGAQLGVIDDPTHYFAHSQAVLNGGGKWVANQPQKNTPKNKCN